MREIKAHTGLRGIAAFSVFLAHAQFDQLWPGALWLGGLYHLFYWQNQAVDLFFMLSGFVLNYVYLKERRLKWGNYFRARFARICPLYYAGLLAVILMNYAALKADHADAPNLHGPVLAANLAMVQEWPGIGHYHSINVPSWSISVEVFLYVAIFPLLVVSLGRMRPRKAVSGTLLGVALILSALAGNASQDGPNIALIQTARGVTGFCAGFLVCELIYSAGAKRISPVIEMLLLAAVVAAIVFAPLHPLLVFLFAALMAVTYLERSMLARLLGSRPFEYLGIISYSIYIWHFPVIKAATLVFHIRNLGGLSSHSNLSMQQELIYCAVTFFMVLLVAHLSYFLFETRARAFLLGRKAKPSTKRDGLIEKGGPLPHTGEVER
jgi:peptidoglycan/LPS O-acetylase OafA/YrhL